MVRAGSWKRVALLVSALCVIAVQLTWHHNPETLGARTDAIKQQIQRDTALGQLDANDAVPINSSKIPKILHYVFKSDMAFEPYKPLIRSCLDRNPDWQVLLWRDSDSEKLVQQHYKYFADKFRSYGDRLEKSDAIRYMILHRFGGIYLDMDVQCLKPFDQLLQLRDSDIQAPPPTAGISAFLGEERREQTRILYGYSFCTMNSLMGSSPGHPFFQHAIHRMQSMPNVNHARLSTGPDFLTKVYGIWANSSEGRRHPVHVFPARLVSPLMDTSMVNWCQKCELYFKQNQQRMPTDAPVWAARGCGELVAKGWRFDDTDASTVAVHRFLHLGYGSQSGRATFPLFREFPRIKTFYPV